ncbi:MAG: hypothetical protein ACXWGA_10440 [Actinomycetota bacterium]
MPPPSGAGRWRRVLVALAAVAIAIGAAAWLQAGRTSQDHPSQPAAHTAAPPVSEAVLAGSYQVELVTTAAKGWESHEVGDRATETWSFSPDGTRLNGHVMGGSWVIELDRAGASAHGSAKAQLSECQFTPVTDSLRVRMKVEAGHNVGDRWVARRFVGTFHMYSPPATSGLWSCQGSSLTARLVGTQR